jgi:hypothetical protein
MMLHGEEPAVGSIYMDLSWLKMAQAQRTPAPPIGIPPPAPPPPAPSALAVKAQAVQAIGSNLGKGNYVQAAVGAATLLNPALGVVAAGAAKVADLLGLSFESKSKANWDRTLGRMYRAGFPVWFSKILYTHLRSKDPTGGKLWDAVVEFFQVPTEKQSGQTKHGYAANPPIPVRNNTNELKLYLSEVKA